MIRSILVAVDTSEQAKVAAAYASFLAYKLDAVLEAVYVIDSRLTHPTYWIDYGAFSLPARGFVEELQRLLREQGEALLDEVRRNAEKAGVHCRGELREGLPAPSILAAAADCDLITLGRRGESSRLEGGSSLGSVAERVLRSARQSVLCTADTFQELRRVVLAFDGSEPAKAVMRDAVELAERLKLPLLTVSVARDAARNSARLDVVANYAAAHGVTIERRSGSGDVVDELLELLQEGDLLAMGAFGEGRVRELLLGSTTEAMLRRAAVPVLLHR